MSKDIEGDIIISQTFLGASRVAIFEFPLTSFVFEHARQTRTGDWVTVSWLNALEPASLIRKMRTK